MANQLNSTGIRLVEERERERIIIAALWAVFLANVCLQRKGKESSSEQSRVERTIQISFVFAFASAFFSAIAPS